MKTAPLLESPVVSPDVVRPETVQPVAVPGGERTAVSIREADGFVAMIERIVANPDVPVDKLERLLAMNERILDRNAKAEFEAAFAEMQGELPEITERGRIVVNGQTRSTYARFEDIIAEIRPILTKHGFALRHENKQEGEKLTVVGILSHRCGHSVRDEFIAEADNSGAKNDIQQVGSTRSYGQRYTTISLLNIVTRGADDDGQRSQKTQAQLPDGYQAWLEGMEDVALEGFTKLKAHWKETPEHFRNYVFANQAQWWARVKAAAQKADKARA